MAGLEIRIVQDCLQERDIRRDATDTELGDRPPRPIDGGGEVAVRQVSLTSMESKWGLTSAPRLVPPSRRMPAPPGLRYVVIRPVSGRNPLAGSSVVMRHCNA